MVEYDLTYLSLGAGVQSSALLVLGCTGKIPKPDLAIFADVGDEPQYVYDYLKLLSDYAAGHGVPVEIARKGHLSHDLTVGQRAGKRFAPVPLYTAGLPGKREGMLRRQCTREYKIEPITQHVRRHLGLKKGQRCKSRVRCMIGISTDEVTRMKPSLVKWTTNTFPLIDLDISRSDCLGIVTAAGLPEPKKSSCVFCPYHSDEFWVELKSDYPKEFAKAVAFDEQIRDMTMRGTKQPGYVHRSCVPLLEVDFHPDRDQINMFENECEGMCGV